MASLSEADRVRVRHHLGYLNTLPSASIQLGFPAATETGFLVERAMSFVIDEAVPRIQRALNELDCIEDQQSKARSRFSAQQLGELKIRNGNDEKTEVELLQESYWLWQSKLANYLGVPVNPFAQAGAPGVAPGNIRRVLG